LRSKPSARLKNGARLNQQTFHTLYEASPPGFRAELIGGVVHVPSPLKNPHGEHGFVVIHWLGDYVMHTPGVKGTENATHILGPDSEPQPDVSLRILSELGGNAKIDADGFLVGPPELIVQISDSTEKLDLNERKHDLEAAGVREYLVVAVRKQKVFWFVRRRGKFKELAANRDGILRSEVFPGLWLDPTALFAMDWKRLSAVLGLGLASPEHAAFVEKMGKGRA